MESHKGQRQPTSGKLLMRVIDSIHPDHDVSSYHMSKDVDMHEVFPGLFIGDMSTAKNKEYLKFVGITHVVNAAENPDGKDDYTFPNTGEGYYEDLAIVYKGLPLADLSTTDIAKHFHEVADFIEEAQRGGGRVLVHCLVGISRSATLVLAYLMIKQGMTAKQAIRVVRKHRYVYPNQGFLDQLAELDNKLSHERFMRDDDDEGQV